MPEGFGTEQAAPLRRMLFFYNSALLPEYISAVAISLIVNTPTLLIPIVVHWPQVKAGQLLVLSPCFWCSTLAFFVFSVFLVWKTLHYRRIFSRLKVILDITGKLWIDFPEGRLCINDVVDCKEKLGWYFERPARFLYMMDPIGTRWDISDGLYGYDQIRKILTEAGRLQIPCNETAERIEKVRQKWNRRHEHFVKDPLEGEFTTHTSRVFCLIPILLVDAIFSGFGQLAVAGQGLAWVAPTLAPIGLLVSAAVSRLIYYRMLTNVFLNSSGFRR